MSKLNEFIQLLQGRFDNKEQFESLNDEDFPYAKHVNTICNNKIVNLPNDFKGVFMVQESYYITKGRKNAQPHFFLFTEEDNQIKLTSCDTPDGYDKNTFTYANLKD